LYSQVIKEEVMRKRISVMVAMVAVLFLAGQVLASGPGSQNRSASRTPGMTGPQQGVMSQQRNMDRQQTRQQPEQRQNAEQRMERRTERSGPQANLPEQASDTARAAVGHAGMGRETADAVQARQRARIHQEPAAGLPDAPAAQ
jgi:hypothetical protein